MMDLRRSGYFLSEDVAAEAGAGVEAAGADAGAPFDAGFESEAGFALSGEELESPVALGLALP